MIRSAILRLYKQHQMVKYNEQLTEGDYSCWGNYDSMSVQAVKKYDDNLIKSRDAMGLMDIWYELSEATGEQDGTYAQQCIGLLLEEDDDGIHNLDQFINGKEIFLCACLIQFNNDDTYKKDSYAHIRERDRILDTDSIYLYVLSFRTLDNADMVVLIKGNSYRVIMDEILELGRNVSVVAYTYSVCGVNWKYVQEPEKNEVEHKLKNDKIFRISTKIVANPHIVTDELIKQFGGKGEWGWIFGNTDLLWNITEAGMGITRAIGLMGYNNANSRNAISHLNPLYGEYIYNISTDIILDQNEYMNMGIPYSGEKTKGKEGWCRQKIKVLRDLMETVKKSKDDTLYSYLLSFLHILSMIVQYEESKFAEDIFLLICPSLKMFYQKLKKTVECINEVNNGKPDKDTYKMDEKLKDNMTCYINMLDQIIYRSIHTEQTFFLIPGYGGTIYNIPSKLSLMYTAFLYAGIHVLRENGREYSCCLYPVIDSETVTTEIRFSKDENDTLIEMCVSQREIYSGNLMLILLLHELAHYVGDTRNREFRIKNLMNVWSGVLTEMIFSEWELELSDEQTEWLKIISEDNSNEVQDYIFHELDSDFFDQEIYFTEVVNKIVSTGRKIYVDKDGLLRDLIQKKGEHLKRKLQNKKKDDKELISKIAELEKLYIVLEERLGSDWVVQIIEMNQLELKQIFKETYADIVALCVIGDSNNIWDRYFEVFQLSKGRKLSGNDISMSLINRAAAVVEIMTSMFAGMKCAWMEFIKRIELKFREANYQIEEMDCLDCLALYAGAYREQIKGLRPSRMHKIILKEMKLSKDDMMSICNYPQVWEDQIGYLRNACVSLKRHLNIIWNNGDDVRRKALLHMRRLYSMLNDPKSGSKTGYADLNELDELIRWYINNEVKIKQQVIENSGGS